MHFLRSKSTLDSLKVFLLYFGGKPSMGAPDVDFLFRTCLSLNTSNEVVEYSRLWSSVLFSMSKISPPVNEEIKCIRMNKGASSISVWGTCKVYFKGTREYCLWYVVYPSCFGEAIKEFHVLSRFHDVVLASYVWICAIMNLLCHILLSVIIWWCLWKRKFLLVLIMEIYS